MIFDYADHQWIERFITNYGYSKSNLIQLSKHLETQRISDYIEEDDL